MKQPRLYAVVMAVLAAVLLFAPNVLAQQYAVPVQVFDDSGNVRTVVFGSVNGGSACIDTADGYGIYQEFELPPVPPTNVFDARFISPVTDPGQVCYGQGSLVDLRTSQLVAHTDTFLLAVQEGTGGRPIHLTWASGLGSVATAMNLVDPITGTLFNIDMLTQTSFDLPAPYVSAFIYVTPVLGPPVSNLFLSVTPMQIFNEDPLKPFKSQKLSKRFKGLLPNMTNLVAETVVQGAFQPGTSESDSAGGIRVGHSYMYLKDPVKKKWAPVKDSANIYAWVRLSKWDFKKNLGKSYGDLQKSLKDKTGEHINQPSGLDSTNYPGALKRKPLKKQLTKLPPKKQNNRMFTELAALKFNIGASALGKTPAGYGELIYTGTPAPFTGMSIKQIAAELDMRMTHWQGTTYPEWDAIWTMVYNLNRAFYSATPIDTVSWEAGGEDVATLVVKGQVDISTVPFLQLPPLFVPTRVTPTNNLAESPEDYEFEEDEEFEDAEGMPAAVKLYQNFPNPFNPATTLAFRLNESASVTITVYDMLGRELGVLADREEFEEGMQTVDFNAADLASGVYLYRITGQGLDSGNMLSPVVGKMMLVK